MAVKSTMKPCRRVIALSEKIDKTQTNPKQPRQNEPPTPVRQYIY